MASVDSKTHFPLIQTLRGIAAMWVVLFHAAEGHHIDRLLAALPRFLGALLFEDGHFGVPIFFALSGFVIAHSLRDVPLSGSAFARFALRRSIRLDPPYWASMIIILAIGFLSAKVKHDPFALPGAGTVVAHIFYLQQILGLPAISVVYWTLTYEIQFYLFLAGMLTLAALFASGRARQAAWAIMTLLAFLSAFNGFFWLRDGIFLNLWAAFFLGVLAYKAIDSRIAQVAGVLLILSSIVVLNSFLIMSAATALLMWIAATSRAVQRHVPLAFGHRLGTISYSLYLIHNPLTGATGFVGHRLLGTSILADVAVLAMIVIVSVAGAAALWWLVERPAHRWSRKIRLARAVPEPPVADRL